MWESLNVRRTAPSSSQQARWEAVVRDLVGPGEDVNVRDVFGKTPLLRAAEAGKLGVVLELLRRGANPIARTPEGWNALHLAAGNGHLEVVSQVRPVSPQDVRRVRP